MTKTVQHKQSRGWRGNVKNPPLCGYEPPDDPKRPNYSVAFFMHDQWKMVTCPACLALRGKKREAP